MDEIQQKLAEIDRQLAAGPAYYSIRATSTAPLLPCAIGLMCGIVVQNAVSLPAWLWAAILVFSTAAIAILHLQKHAPAQRLVLLSSCALVSFMCLGAIRVAAFYHAGPGDIRNWVGPQRKLATVRGHIISTPFVSDDNDWLFGRLRFSDPRTSFYLRVGEALTTAGWAKASGTVRVQVDAPLLNVNAGDYVQLYCWLENPKPPGNPGQFDFSTYLAHSGVWVTASVGTKEGIEALNSNTGEGIAKFKEWIRDRADETLIRNVPPEGDVRGLLEALVLGYRSKISARTLAAFRKTGLFHFISLSGMNFAIVIAVVWWVCKTAGLMKQARAAVSIIAAILFLLIVPRQPPAVRAAIICFAFCGAFFFSKHSNPFNSLSLAAIVTLMMKPTDLFRPDWQLSFAAVLGILLFAKRIDNLLREQVSELFARRRITETLVLGATGFVSPMVGTAFATSVAAWVATAGILVYHFYSINWLTTVWTVIVSLLIAVVSVMGYAKLLAAPLLLALAGMLTAVIVPFTGLLILIVEQLGRVNTGPVLIGRTGLWVVVLYYAAILFAGYVPMRRPFVKGLICAAILTVPLGWVAIAKWTHTHRDNLTVTVLDVGHGQAILAELPGRKNILFDAGSLTHGDIGTRIVVPFLQYKEIDRIDSIIVSHSDIDHFNGVPEIVDETPVGHIFAGRDFLDQAENRGAEKLLADYLSVRGLAARCTNGALSGSHAANVTILWPPDDIYADSAVGDNDKSIVSLIECGGRKILLCSDIEKYAQGQLLQMYPDLKVDVIVAPHHGSRTTALPGFVEQLGARFIVCSCGRDAYEDGRIVHTGPNQEMYCTARDGAVTIRIGGDGDITAEGFIKKEQPLPPR